MKDLIEELLSLHKTAQADRSKLATLQTEHEAVLKDGTRLVGCLTQQERQVQTLQEMLTSINAAITKELGLHTAYQKSVQQLSGASFLLIVYHMIASHAAGSQCSDVAIVADVHAEVDTLLANTDKTLTELQDKLKQAQQKEADLSSTLAADRQAHAATIASLQHQVEQVLPKQMQDVHHKVLNHAPL